MSAGHLSFLPFFRRIWADLFGIDPRALALFRVGVASVLLYNLAQRVVDLESMYGPQGLLPIDSVVGHSRSLGLDTNWSLYFLDPSLMMQAGLFVCSALFAVALMLGLYTRVSTIVSWVLLASLHGRTPILVNGGDVLLSMLLFWGMFLPLGCCFSLDNLRRRAACGLQKVVSVPAACILLQVVMMYLFTAVSKCNSVWYSGEALGRALSFEMYVRPLGRWLLNFPTLLAVGTHATLWLELLCPFMLFFPWGNRFTRPAAVVILAGLHVGIELTMNVALFSFASLAGLSLFLPPAVWQNQIVQKLRRAVALSTATSSESLSSELPTIEPPSTGAAARRSRLLVWARDVACVGLSLFVFAWNTATITLINYHTSLDLQYAHRPWPPSAPPWSDARQKPGSFVVACSRFANFAGPWVAGLKIDQRWDMFSHPPDADYRLVARAVLRDGSVVDILREGAIVNLADPKSLPPAVANVRWMLVHVGLSGPQFAAYSQEYSEYLRRQWNASHLPQRQVESLQLIFLQSRDPSLRRETARILVLAEIGLAPGSWIVRDQEGRKLAEGRFRYGRREGRWEVYYPSGSKQAEGIYVGGQQRGQWIFWYENGAQESAGELVNQQKIGSWRHWHDNGRLSERGAYQSDKKHGKWEIWHRNGKRHSSGSFRNDKEEGNWRFWDENGRLEGEGTFRDGEFHGRWVFYDDGRPRVEEFRQGKPVGGGFSVGPDPN